MIRGSSSGASSRAPDTGISVPVSDSPSLTSKAMAVSMSSHLERGAFNEKTAAIARDVTVAFTIQNSIIRSTTAEASDKGLAAVYTTMFAVARKLVEGKE
jgi:hypothetical protein